MANESGVTPVMKTGVTGGRWIHDSYAGFGGGGLGTYSPSRGYNMTGTWFEPTYGQVVDEQATAGKMAVKYQGLGDAAMSNASAAAQQGVQQAQAAQQQAQPFFQNAASALGGMTQGINGVYGAAQKVGDVAGQVLPYMQTLTNYGNQLWDQGANMYGQGQNLVALANGIFNMDATSGIGGEYVKYLKSLDPNSMVSLAASDVQSSFQNAHGQAQRNMSRSGVDAGSNRYASLQEQFASSLATALAGAKTRARMLGLQNQGAAFKDALSQAQSIFTTGENTSSAGASAQSSAGQMQANAANIGVQAGGLYDRSGQLQSTAAQLQGTQASGYNSLAGGLLNAGRLGIDAQKALATVEQNAATYYAQIGQGWGQIAGSGGLMRALFN